jgi:hypothetical protein
VNFKVSLNTAKGQADYECGAGSQDLEQQAWGKIGAHQAGLQWQGFERGVKSK